MPMAFTNNPKRDAAKADFVVCLRVKDYPIPRRVSKIERCKECGERIWFADTSPVGPPLICNPCCVMMMATSKDKLTLMVSETTRQLAGPEQASGIEALMAAAGEPQTFEQLILPTCPSCGGQTRMDDPFLMCDRCRTVVGMRVGSNAVE